MSFNFPSHTVLSLNRKCGEEMSWLKIAEHLIWVAILSLLNDLSSSVTVLTWGDLLSWVSGKQGSYCYPQSYWWENRGLKRSNDWSKGKQQTGELAQEDSVGALCEGILSSMWSSLFMDEENPPALRTGNSPPVCCTLSGQDCFPCTHIFPT